jgi:hypothetical protein
MTFGHGVFDRMSADTIFRAETPESGRDTSYDISGTDPVDVHWYSSTQSYWWNRSKCSDEYTGRLKSTFSSATDIADWLNGTLNCTKGKGVKFMTLGPNDTSDPIDCIMFNWSYDEWSEWSKCTYSNGAWRQKRTRLATRSAKTYPANGGEPCGDTSKTETQWRIAPKKNATVGSWSAFSDCKDNGEQCRTRMVATAASCGGTTPSLKDCKECVAEESDEPVVTDDDTTITSDDEQGEIDATDDTSTNGDTTITTQSTAVAAVVAPEPAGMSNTMKGVIALVVVGGAAFFISKRKK